ncbi:MAG: hypothetical protein AB7E10_07080 [Burkholderiaceae bacterium]
MGVDSENAPRRDHFLPDSPPHGGAMGQEDGVLEERRSQKWTAAAHSQPTIPKSDRLLGSRDMPLSLAPAGPAKVPNRGSKAYQNFVAEGLARIKPVFSIFGSLAMSSHSSTVQHSGNEAADPVEQVTSVVPVVLPIVGALLMFLLAFIAVSMA